MRVSIKMTLIGVIGFLLIAIGGQGIFAAWALRAVNANLTDITRDWLPSVRLIGELKYRVTRLRLVDARYVTALEPLSELGKTGATRLAAVTAAAQKFDLLISSPEEGVLWDGFKQKWAVYVELRGALIAAAEAGDRGRTSDLFDKSRSAFNEAIDLLDKDSELNDRGSAKASMTAAQSYETALWLTGVIGLGAVLCGLGGIVFVVAGVMQPIDRTVAVMGRLAAGDASADVPYQGRGDEMGAIAAAVQVFKDNLIRTRALEADSAQTREDAAIQRRAAMREMADGFERAVSGIVGGVTAAATQLQATAQSMAGTATQTASQTTTVAAAAEEAASNVTTVAAAAEELGSSVQEIGRQVDGSAKLAQSAVTEADHTAALVQDLSAAASKIGTVVSVISSIAAQTNLLALNATIEAARAGEAGRGFAVVAAEVKELATQTSRATEEISEQIGRIQGSTGQAVSAIGAITGRIREISSVATSIAAAVEEQGAATQEIVRNVSQAATGTGEVTSNISGVAQAAEATGAAAGQVLSAASALSHQSEQLSTEVGRFLATVRAT